MNFIMSLLACICIVWVFVEFQSEVDGPGMSFVGGIIWGLRFSGIETKLWLANALITNVRELSLFSNRLISKMFIRTMHVWDAVTETGHQKKLNRFQRLMRKFFTICWRHNSDIVQNVKTCYWRVTHIRNKCAGKQRDFLVASLEKNAREIPKKYTACLRARKTRGYQKLCIAKISRENTSGKVWGVAIKFINGFKRFSKWAGTRNMQISGGQRKFLDFFESRNFFSI